MLILTTVRPAHSTNPKEMTCFTWDGDMQLEKQRAGKFIADALYRYHTVLSRRISQRLPQHMEVLRMPVDYFTRSTRDAAVAE